MALMWYAVQKRIRRIQHPHAVVKARVNHIIVDDDLLETSLLLTLLYIVVVFVSSVLLCTMGMDLLTAFSAVAMTMGNVGPVFGPVGSIGNFVQVPDLGKWLLSGNMLLGRLEIYGIPVFLLLKSWK